MFSNKQISYLYSLGLHFDFNNLSDDNWIEIEEKVGDILSSQGFDDATKEINDEGIMCESILDLLP